MARRRRSKYGAIFAQMELAGQFSVEMVEHWLQQNGHDPRQGYNVINLFRSKREPLNLYRGVYSTRSVKDRKTLDELHAELARNLDGKPEPAPEPPMPEKLAEPDPEPEPMPDVYPAEISKVEAFRRELAELLGIPAAKIRITIQVIG